jgi:tRNA nucleotidyltransferase (CCA-adding enzyme)
LRAQLRHAIESGFYEQVRGSGLPVPALRNRLRSELKYLFEGEDWRRGLVLLEDLLALRCIHPELTVQKPTVQTLRRLAQWIQVFGSQTPAWQIMVEGLLASLPPSAMVQAAENLQMPPESLARLAALGQIDQLPWFDKPSDWCRALDRFDRATLILAGAWLPERRRILQRYLREWSGVKPWLDGTELKALGYVGKALKPILVGLREGRLDGAIANELAALDFVRRNYPLG